MALLAWIFSRKMFLKVQEGTCDNLSSEDVNNGFVDYILWSTFRPECIDIDGELEMCSIDGGMVMFKNELTQDDFESAGLQGAYEQAFNRPFSAEDAMVLMNDYDEEDTK